MLRLGVNSTAEMTNPERRDIIKEASELSDRIDLQGSDIDRVFYEAKCSRCPANDGIVYDMSNRRNKLYCALQASLLSGNVEEAAEFSDAVEHAHHGNPGCAPNFGGRRMKDYRRLLNDVDDV